MNALQRNDMSRTHFWRTTGFQLRTNGVYILAEDAVSATVTKRPHPLLHYGRRDGGVLFQPFGDGGFEGIELAFALPLGGPLRP